MGWQILSGPLFSLILNDNFPLFLYKRLNVLRHMYTIYFNIREHYCGDCDGFSYVENQAM